MEKIFLVFLNLEKITYFDYVTNSEFYAKHTNSSGLAMNIIKAPRVSEAFLDITYLPNECAGTVKQK